MSLGSTVGLKANGAVSNLSVTGFGISTMLRELRTGRYDVVHIHEPVAPLISWVAADRTQLPLVGTFHTTPTSRSPTGSRTCSGPDGC